MQPIHNITTDFFANKPSVPGFLLLTVSWAMSLCAKLALNIDLHSLFANWTPEQAVGVLSGLGSLALSIITGTHYLLKIKQLLGERKENKRANEEKETDDQELSE